MDEPIRIISDLHLGHRASLVLEIAQVEPLFADIGTLIFNGDTLELRSVKSRQKGEATLAAVREFCDTQPATSLFINGNHDPVISTCNHLEVAQGRVLVTHGDILFHDVAPWSDQASGLRQASDRILNEMEERELSDLEALLSANKRISQTIDYEDISIPNGTWGKVATFMKQAWPPHRFVSMMSCWRRAPGHAINLIRTYRPDTEVIVVGHTHFPGVWRRGKNTVINTGSYLPVLGRLAVDITGDTILVRRVVLRQGRFHLDRQVARFRLRTAVRPSAARSF